MYISGHHEILDAVIADLLKEHGEAFFEEGWPGRPSLNRLDRALRLGLIYPDMPCGKVSVSGTAVAMRHPRLCNVVSLAALLSPTTDLNQYTELAQAHVGALVHWHAMSPTHATTASEVAASIVRTMLSHGLLFLRGASSATDCRYAIWLGVALHTLTDSYADSHAIRVPNVPIVAAKPPDAKQERLMRHAALLNELARRTLGAGRRPLSVAELSAAILAARRNDVTRLKPVMHRGKQHETYLLFLLRQQADRDVRLLLPTGSPASKGKVGPAGKHDIRAFSHYSSQGMAYHALGDRISLVRGRPAMWRRMLDECADLIRLFRDAARGSLSPETFLARLRSFLLSRPFRLAPGAASRPAMNYAS